MSRKVLVTAGASGIGKHIAAAFLAAGDDVYACDINSDALKTASTELSGLKTGVCDVTDRVQSKKMARRHRRSREQRRNFRAHGARAGPRT